MPSTSNVPSISAFPVIERFPLALILLDAVICPEALISTTDKSLCNVASPAMLVVPSISTLFAILSEANEPVLVIEPEIVPAESIFMLDHLKSNFLLFVDYVFSSNYILFTINIFITDFSLYMHLTLNH